VIFTIPSPHNLFENVTGFGFAVGDAVTEGGPPFTGGLGDGGRIPRPGGKGTGIVGIDGLLLVSLEAGRRLLVGHLHQFTEGGMGVNFRWRVAHPLAAATARLAISWNAKSAGGSP